jgi:hypothetical protein
MCVENLIDFWDRDGKRENSGRISKLRERKFYESEEKRENVMSASNRRHKEEKFHCQGWNWRKFQVTFVSESDEWILLRFLRGVLF